MNEVETVCMISTPRFVFAWYESTVAIVAMMPKICPMIRSFIKALTLDLMIDWFQWFI